MLVIHVQEPTLYVLESKMWTIEAEIRKKQGIIMCLVYRKLERTGMSQSIDDGFMVVKHEKAFNLTRLDDKI